MSCSVTAAARSVEAMPVHRQWPGFDAGTRQSRLFPSSAIPYVPSSSSQNATSNAARSTSACDRSSVARAPSPSASARSAAARRAA